jgi:type 1 glutamine amidotransferase
VIGFQTYHQVRSVPINETLTLLEKPILKRVLIISDGIFHPTIVARFWLRKTLSMLPAYEYKQVRSMEELPMLDLSLFHGLVLFFHHQKITESALNAFEEFVLAGGGVLAIHSATASFKDSARFTNILGGKFSDHGPVEGFDIHPTQTATNIFDEIPVFRVIDELYLHDNQSDIEIHFIASHEKRSVPIVWTRNHGNGRICFASPGHRATSLRVPAYQQILRRGLIWVCKDEYQKENQAIKSTGN